MCWATIKAFFAKSKENKLPAEGEAAAEEAEKRVDVAAWTFADPLRYVMEDGEVVALKRARDFYLMEPEDRDAVAAATSAAVTGALDAALAAGGERAVWDMAAAEIDGVYRGAVRLYDKQVKAEVVAPYLKATVKPFFEWLQAHGMVAIHCSNCAFETLGAVFHDYIGYFGAAGLVFISNQHRALQMMQDNDLPEEEYDAKREEYLDKAFFFTRRLQKDCAERGRSFVCLDADGNSRTYAQALSYAGKPGYLVVERSGALRQFDRFPMKVTYPKTETAEE